MRACALGSLVHVWFEPVRLFIILPVSNLLKVSSITDPMLILITLIYSIYRSYRMPIIYRFESSVIWDWFCSFFLYLEDAIKVSSAYSNDCLVEFQSYPKVNFSCEFFSLVQQHPVFFFVWFNRINIFRKGSPVHLYVVLWGNSNDCLRIFILKKNRLI